MTVYSTANIEDISFDAYTLARVHAGNQQVILHSYIILPIIRYMLLFLLLRHQRRSQNPRPKRG